MSGSSADAELIERARAHAEGAYAPYSKFHVGAIVVAADGREFHGVNVENAAYGSTMCAEAIAIGTAVGRGARKIDTVALATLEGADHFPCGHCRQMMLEFGVERVLVRSRGGEVRTYILSELLPHGFGADDLPEVGEGPRP